MTWTHAQPIETQPLTDGITFISPLASGWLNDEAAGVEAEAVNEVLREQDDDPYEESVTGWDPYVDVVAIGRWYCDGAPCQHEEHDEAEWVWEHAWLVR